MPVYATASLQEPMLSRGTKVHVFGGDITWTLLLPQYIREQFLHLMMVSFLGHSNTPKSHRP